VNHLPRPHGDKLVALLANAKLPTTERHRIEAALERYTAWLAEMDRVVGGTTALEPLLACLNEYKFFLDVELVFGSDTDFLYRQKGQLKLDNTIIEEFLPWLVSKVLEPELRGKNLLLGPTTCFSALRFESDMRTVKAGGGMMVRSKDHDFAISRKVFLRSSHHADFSDGVNSQTAIAYIAAECKTNLDKTMFQEAAATALDVKTAVPGAKYFLLCEWLDMTPISTATTAIDEVIILRKNRRLGSDVRKHFSSLAGRQAAKPAYIEYLQKNPYSTSSFERFLSHVQSLIGGEHMEEGAILARGWF
jgi:hypothetical protein